VLNTRHRRFEEQQTSDYDIHLGSLKVKWKQMDTYGKIQDGASGGSIDQFGPTNGST